LQRKAVYSAYGSGLFYSYDAMAGSTGYMYSWTNTSAVHQFMLGVYEKG
jgi:hypothetical protein